VKPEESDPKETNVESDFGEVKYMHDLTFASCEVTIEMYDDMKEDHDTVSVYFNGNVIVQRDMLRNKKNGSIIRLLVLDMSKKKNELVVRAWNTGDVGPNTLRINLYNGDLTGNPKKLKRATPFQEKILHSNPGLSAGIKLRCRK